MPSVFQCFVLDGATRHWGWERNVSAVKTESRCNVSGC